MAQLLTAPETNPNVRDDKPNQIRDVKPTAKVLITGVDVQQNFRPRDILDNLQLDFSMLAMKDKFVNFFPWKTTDGTGLLKSIWVDNALCRKAFGSITNRRFQFLDFEYLKFSILPTNNSQYCGELVIAWAPLPNENYFETLYNVSIHNDPRIFTQFQNVRFEPNDSNVVEILIPMKSLNKFIPGNITIADGVNSVKLKERNNFLNSIIFGYINFYVLTPLQTKASNLELNISYSVSVYNAKTGAVTYL